MQVLPELAHAHTQISSVFSVWQMSTLPALNSAMGLVASQNQSMPKREYFNMLPGLSGWVGGFPELVEQFAEPCALLSEVHMQKKHQHSNQSCDSLRWSLFIITEVNTKSYRYEYTCKAYFPALTFSRKNSFPESDRRHHWPAGNYCGWRF